MRIEEYVEEYFLDNKLGTWLLRQALYWYCYEHLLGTTQTHNLYLTMIRDALKYTPVRITPEGDMDVDAYGIYEDLQNGKIDARDVYGWLRKRGEQR